MIDIKYYRIQKNINRLSLLSIHREYNLLEHQFMVAVLFKEFAILEEIEFGFKEFDIVMNHDILEAVSSDLPWPVKSLNEKTKQAWEIIEDELLKQHPKLHDYSDSRIRTILNFKQYALFKAADYLDLWIFVREEILLGNRAKQILEVEQNCVRLITEICNINFFFHILKFMEHYEG